jgi:hypothetical protein
MLGFYASRARLAAICQASCVMLEIPENGSVAGAAWIAGRNSDGEK